MTTVTFIGAGSAVFTRQLVNDLCGMGDLGAFELRLHDIDAERLEVARGTAEQIARRRNHPITVVATQDLAAAVAGTDFVVNMIQVGGIEATRRDLEIPAAFGLTQTIGDTTGVGGVFRALRTFPVLTQIADAMREHAPDAWLLNYTNPMAMNLAWLAATAPDIKAVGLCHSVYWTAHDLGELIGVPVEETDYEAAGVNHQAWLLRWEKKDGEDLYPRLRATIDADPELSRRVRVEMFRRMGYYPTETSEHSSEYLPWFLRSPEQIAQYRIEPQCYLGISEDNVAEYEAAKAALAAGDDLELADEQAEYAPQIIHAMATGGSIVIHGNVPNARPDGTLLIDNLPKSCTVEVPCDVDAAGVHPRRVGNLPLPCAALNRSYVSVNELTVAAAQLGDPVLVRQACLMDPNTSSTLTPQQIWDLCEALTQAHGDLLPEPLRRPVPRTGW